MKKIYKRTVYWLAALLLFALAGCQATNATTPANSEYTGFLEGDKVDVATEVGGRLTAVEVQEGQVIAAGDRLVRIEDDLVQARIAGADANVAAAQAQLALLQAGAPQEEIRRAQAKVDQASAALDAATQALADAKAIRANPQVLVIAQAKADAQAKVAAQELAAAVAQAQAADQLNQLWEAQVRSLWDGVQINLPGGGGTLHFDIAPAQVQPALQEWNKAGNVAWQAWTGVQQAQAAVNAANAALKDINEQLANPIALDARVDQASAARERAAAMLQAAQAGLQALRDGASPAQLQSARAAVDQARAARATLDQELARYAVNAPQGGTINRVYYRLGEMALPSVPVVRITIAGDLTLRVFVPMSILETIRIGEQETVRVEGIDARTFTGTVSRINDKAEFAARQVQTDTERNAQLVAVEILIKNAEGVLKAGMPATVKFQ